MRQPEPTGNLASFARFSEEMNRLPQLKGIYSQRYNALLRALYHTARFKARMEAIREEARKNIPAIRDRQVRFARARPLLKQALRKLEEARERYRPQLEDMEATGRLLHFAEIARNLESAIQLAAEFQAFWKAVDPKVRKPIEKGFSPLGKRLSAIDHWFMGAAASTLDDYPLDSGERIKNYEKIIEKIFTIAFGDEMVTEGAIAIELQRQKRDPDRLKSNGFLSVVGFPDAPEIVYLRPTNCPLPEVLPPIEIPGTGIATPPLKISKHVKRTK